MTTQTVEFEMVTGETGATAKLFAAGSDTVVATASPTEATNRKGVYAASFTDIPAGTYRLVGIGSDSVPLTDPLWVVLTLTTATFVAYIIPNPATAENQTTILSRLGTPTNLGSGATISKNLEDINSAIEAINLSGPGDDTVTIVINDTEGSPVEAVAVWLSTDSNGFTVVAGTSYTDANGEVVFLLTAGATYYLWAHKAGLIDIRARSFVAVAD